MSLTQAEAVFASIHETALNDIVTAFCFHRPRLLFYGSPAFVPATTVAETQMDAIGFPGVPGGIQWRVRLTVPRVDLFKQTDALPPELALGPNQFSIALGAEICIECRKIRIDPKPPRPNDEGRDNRGPVGAKDDHPLSELTCFRLQVFGVGHLERVVTGSGAEAIALGLDAIEIIDIAPESLENFLECLLFMILQAVLADIRIPLDSLSAGFFSVNPTVGPLIEDDQIKARGLFTVGA